MSNTLRNPNPLPRRGVPRAPSASPAGSTPGSAPLPVPSPAAGGPAERRSSAGADWLPRLGRGLTSRYSLIAAALLLPVALLFALGGWWSLQPAKFDVVANAESMLGAERADTVQGATTVAAAVQVAETLLRKPGGWLHNDRLPPGVLMDNMPAWEYGALTELRDSVRAMRNDFSRSQTQSIEHEALKNADAELSFDPNAWFLPSAEDEYRQGTAALRSYLQALVSGRDSTARFHARADNLGAYLAVVEKRLGSYGQRLTASVGDAELTGALTGAGFEPAAGAQVLERTAWNAVDDVFFEARGYTWALLHMMKALSVDFRKVLEDKNAEVSMQQIIRDLEQASMRKWSPVVLNGNGFGVLANHSLVLASYIARANAAVLDLRVLLQRG
ncbi:DUF2333 family protein [Thiohalocapsa marina]|uniref:DUF2333 family protein n=1 Tax=Thiohalocapsa marina TaxID=424902 RepID=A0A5M8FS58_9GAMM|nr:DUF2333 family protein [Thiohalocapsa marina]